MLKSEIKVITVNWFNTIFVQAYLWDNNEAVVLWLQEQFSISDSLVNNNVKSVMRDAIIQQIKSALEVIPDFNVS